MDDLIEALKLASPYVENKRNPTYCCHDELWLSADVSKMSPELITRLGELGFFEREGGLCSYRFGSC